MAVFIDTSQALLLLGVFLATALFFLTVYLGLDRKRAYLFFFSYALFEAASLFFLVAGKPLPFLIASTLVNLSLLYFFATFFDVGRSKSIAVIAFVLILIAGVDHDYAVPIGEEINICRVHLDVFNAKQSTRFTLETDNIIAGTSIPPMIFHTLIENGLTHARAERGRFLIEQQESDHKTSFRISSEPLIEQTPEGTGLGLAYVESRLEQAFPGKWSLTSEPANNRWVTTIAIAK